MSVFVCVCPNEPLEGNVGTTHTLREGGAWAMKILRREDVHFQEILFLLVQVILSDEECVSITTNQVVDFHALIIRQPGRKKRKLSNCHRGQKAGKPTLKDPLHFSNNSHRQQTSYISLP